MLKQRSVCVDAKEDVPAGSRSARLGLYRDLTPFESNMSLVWSVSLCIAVFPNLYCHMYPDKFINETQAHHIHRFYGIYINLCCCMYNLAFIFNINTEYLALIIISKSISYFYTKINYCGRKIDSVSNAYLYRLHFFMSKIKTFITISCSFNL